MRHPFLTLIVLLIPIVAIVAVIFLALDTPITIHDAGSTNFQSFDLTVNPDGSGQGASQNGTEDYFDSHTFNFSAIQNGIRTYQNLLELFVKKPVCAKSVSFGSVRTIAYNGLTSGDTSCLTDQTLKGAIDSAVSAASYPLSRNPL